VPEIRLVFIGVFPFCIKAVETARDLNLKTVALTGDTGALKRIVNFNLSVPSNDSQHIQEAHIVAYHVIAESVYQENFAV